MLRQPRGPGRPVLIRNFSLPLSPQHSVRPPYSPIPPISSTFFIIYPHSLPSPHPTPPSSILYDVTELENASRVKKGETERTPKKIANVQKWFAKLDKDFADLLAYY